MLITNGIVNRKINPAKLPEYVAKGYKEVKPAKDGNPEEGKKNKSGKGNQPAKDGNPEEGKNE